MATQSVIPMAVRPPMLRSDLPQEIQDILKKPLPSEAIGKHPRIEGLSSIKAAFVIERLNEAFGVGGWDDEATVLEHHTRIDTWGVGTPKEKQITIYVATVHLQFFVEKYGLHKQNFGGSDNIDLGDALKGARTDALTKIASELGIGLEIYKGGREAAKSELPNCPNCGKQLRRNKDSGEYYCWTKKDGCGANFTEDGLKVAQQSKSAPAKPPQATRQPQQPTSDVPKITIQGAVKDRQTLDGKLWLKVGERTCATMQDEHKLDLKKAWRGAEVELLVSECTGQNGIFYQIHKVVSVKAGGGQ